MKKNVMVTALLICLAIAIAPLASFADDAPAKKYGKEEGTYMKPFSLPAPLENNKVRSSTEFAGKPTLITFIQSACRICQMEVTELNEKYSSLKGSVNVVAIMLDVDSSRIARYQEAFKMPYPVLHDSNAEVAGSVGISSSPATILLSKDGMILKRVSGYNEDMLKEVLAAAK